MPIQYIQTYNIQSHLGEDNIIELPRNGVVRFQGDNNDGKSVIIKVLTAAVQQRLRDPDIRKALITRNHSVGYLKITKYNGDVMKVNVALEARDTYVQTIKGDNDVKRTLSMGGLSDLIEDFGFHYNEKRDMSLNLYNTYDPLLMLTTSGVMNLDILESATQDIKAVRAIETIQQVRKTGREERDKAKINLTSYETVLASIVEYDIEKERSILREAQILYEDLTRLTEIPSTPNLEDVTFLDDLVLLYEPERIESLLEDMNMPDKELINDLEILFSIGKLTDVKEQIEELNEVEEAMEKDICPTCLRPHNSEGELQCRDKVESA